MVFGDAGDDWIEGGLGNDAMVGEFGNPFDVGALAGNDIMIGGAGNDDHDSESGDDIMLADDGIERFEGMLGFDWVSYKYDLQPANADLTRTALVPVIVNDMSDRFENVEGLSGWNGDDILRGDDLTSAELTAFIDGAPFNHALNNQAQIDLIDGLQDLLGAGATSFSGGNIILGGGGSDTIEGRGGDDIIDGDAKLNVRLSIRENFDGTGAEIGWADGMTTAISSANPALDGKTLTQLMFNGTLNPGQLQIVREIITGNTSGEDTAVFSDLEENYDVTFNGDGSTTVAHTRGTQADGTDTLYNIERLVFDSPPLSIPPAADNVPATGAALLDDATPTAPQTLTVNTAGIADANGITGNSFAIQWQSAPDSSGAPGTFVDIGPIGASFTLTQAQVGQFMRAVVTFIDDDGFVETVVSAPTTRVVGNTFVGDVNINTFTGTAGDDILTGAGGIDFFKLTTGFGSDIITDFDANPDGGQDRITNLTALGINAGNFGANVTIVSNGFGGTLVTIAGQGTFDILGVAPGLITDEDFNFAPVGMTLSDNAVDENLAGAVIGAVTVSDANLNDTHTFVISDNRFEVVNGNLKLRDDIDLDFETESNIAIDIQVFDSAGEASAGNPYHFDINVTDDLFETVGPVNGLSIRSSLGAELLNGGALDDIIEGGIGADRVFGGNGHDRFMATIGDGNDRYNGGAGIDTYDLSQTNANSTVNLERGRSSSSETGSDILLSIENVVGSQGNNRIVGNGAANVLDGMAGNDTLSGGGGIDTLFGGAGIDTLGGGAGNDILIGGAGNDAMNGNAGNDTFVFADGFGNDTINGFDANATGGQDWLDIHGTFRN